MEPTLYGEHEEQTGIWTVLNRFMMFAILLAVCAGGAIAFIPLLKKNANVAAHIEKLQADLATEKATYHQRKLRIDQLQNNPEVVENEARKWLNMMKPGEIIIQLEPVSGAAVQPAGRR